MDISSNEFKNKLKELCDSNWKAKAIMDANNNDFAILPRHQKKMFLNAMKIEEVTATIKA
ncbi:hypothetical protein MNBD_GAMMA01-1315 [hydrothermal vent metagenome]|uniref:Uncharacterized protein n=1 Tax=hydrothermal vent metagenome TaxID=652676 RepID=A0A3B0V5T0_9ZZZZ